jgi:hypothetical protein
MGGMEEFLGDVGEVGRGDGGSGVRGLGNGWPGRIVRVEQEVPTRSFRIAVIVHCSRILSGIDDPVRIQAPYIGAYI